MSAKTGPGGATSLSRRALPRRVGGGRRQPRRRLPRSVRRRGAGAGRPRARGQRLGRRQSRRHRRHPHRALGDGAGHADRARAARRRGARLRLGEGPHRVPDAGREPRAQARLGQLLDRRQPRHPRVARLRAQGRRDRADDARAGGGRRVEGAGRRMRRRRRRHHAPAVRAQDDLRQGRAGRGEARAAGRRAAEGPEGLEDRRQAARPPRHRRQDDRQAGLRDRPEAPRHAERIDPRLPGVRRHGQGLQRGGGAEAAGREEGRPRRGPRGRHRRRHLVARRERLRRAEDRVGLRRERAGVLRQVRRGDEGRARCEGSGGGQRGRRRARGARRRGAQDRGRLLVPAPAPRDDGADERDGEVDAGALRGLGADAERRGVARGRRGGLGAADREVRGLQAAPGRRLRPARLPGLHALRGAGREGAAGHAGEAPVVARGGHDARPLPPGHAVQARGRPRQGRQPDRAAHADLRAVDPRRHRAAERQGRQGSGARSRASIRRAPRACSATRCRTC